LFALALLGGIALNVAFFALELFGSAQKHGFEAASGAMLAGAVPAFVMLLFYVPIPMVLDRFDPEPWWSLLGAFLWGALVATGVAGFVNSFVHVAVDRALGADLARLVTTTVSAPISEEVMKGMLVWGVFYFLRREFDGTRSTPR
jgi:RsiW-degrading membrane proteinase PrsW (M82 family)